MPPYANESVIDRIMRDEDVDRDVAQRRFSGLLQFLDVLAGADEPVAPSEPIDSAWHAFILHTADYTNYCHHRFGFFLHHDPAPPGAPPAVDAYRRARRLAEQAFGEDLDPEIWPAA